MKAQVKTFTAKIHKPGSSEVTKIKIKATNIGAVLNKLIKIPKKV